MLKKALINSVNKWLEEVKSSSTIYLSSHVSVDVDNLGSTLALAKVLRSMGKKVETLKSDVIPKAYDFLPGIDGFKENIHSIPDMYISLDSGGLDRLGPNTEIFLASPIKVVIDHHNSNEGYGDINIIDPTISSTCELLYQIFKTHNISYDTDVATLLFAGISGDTGRFLYSNADENTYAAAYDLVRQNADIEAINRNLYQRRSLEKTRILQKVIENMKLLYDGKLNYSVVTKSMLEETGAHLYDLDEAINVLRDVEGVEAAFLVKEAGENLYKVSLRSKSYVPVDIISSRLGGGGHQRAAGLTFKGSEEALVDILIEAMGEYLC